MMKLRLVAKMTAKGAFTCQQRLVARNLATIKFTKSHEYIKLVDANTGVVGITDFAAAALGDVVYVDVPSAGSKFSAGDSFGSVESVKAASDVYAPVSLEVLEPNEVLAEAPGTVNESPFEKGWFIKVKVTEAGKKELDGLLDEAAYKKHVEESAH